MKEAFEKIVERLEHIINTWEEHCEVWGGDCHYNSCSDCVLYHAIEIVEEVAEEYAEKEFSEWCHDCPAYDKENHHCPRLCKVIRTVVEEIKGENNSKWIPISSGNLPDENARVLACNNDGDTMIGYVHWDEAEEDFHCASYGAWMGQVVAWMPIVPYKVEG